jgi:flagellar biosynthesis protein
MAKKRFAAALGYQKDRDRAPKLLAKGRDLVADRIIALAKEHERPVYKDERLSQQLQNLEVGEAIPEELYEIVAEVLIFIAKVDKGSKGE